MKRVSIFGATGSVGLSTLDLVRRDPQSYRVVALTGADRNVRTITVGILDDVGNTAL